jgi:hypothetical protein
MPYQPHGNWQCRLRRTKHHRSPHFALMDTVIDAMLHGTLHRLRVEHISVRIAGRRPRN